MKKRQLINAIRLRKETPYATMARIAEMLCVSRTSVLQWPDRLAGPTYFGHQCALQVLTNGQFKADLSDNVDRQTAKILQLHKAAK